MPRSFSTRMVCSTSCTTSGARPSDGSSNMMSSGAPIRQRPMASICCSPPDIVPASWRWRSARRGNIANTSSQRALRAGARARQQGAHLEVLVHAQRREHLAALGDLADAEVADLGAIPGP